MKRSANDFLYFLSHTLIPDCRASGSEGWVETLTEARTHIRTLQRRLKEFDLPHGPTCGSCYNGILIMNGNEIQRCDECALFKDDDDAVRAVRALLKGGRHV